MTLTMTPEVSPADVVTTVVQKQPRHDGLLRTIIQSMTLTTAIGIFGLMLKTTWILSSAYSDINANQIAERVARLSAEATMKLEYTHAADDLGRKIDNNTQVLENKMTNLGEKITDLRTTLGEIVKASTPVRRP